MFHSLALALATAAAVATAAPALPDRPVDIRTPILRGGPVGATFAAEAGDTLLLMGPPGSGAPTIGAFEDAGGSPHWNGWTSVDDTQPTSGNWQASSTLPVSGACSAWCGSMAYPSCDALDPEGGYGNDWNEMIEWRATVADPQQPCVVRVQALVSHNSETAYDYTWLSCETAAGFVDLWSADGQGTAVPVDESTTYQPEAYVDGDQVVVLFRFTSDVGWSDEDCGWYSDGACRVDDVVITLSNGTGTSTGFEDGTLGPFQPRLAAGVGDFAKLWTGLKDLDPCQENGTTQVAFIDDGVVVPGTGGTACLAWCYGPGGYVVNDDGGLLGPDAHLSNAVVSPPIAWGDPTHDGARLTYTAYLHQDLSASFSGIFDTWAVRSVSTGDPADLADQPWQSSGFLTVAPPGYYRLVRDLDGMLPPDRTHVQIRLGVRDFGYVWPWDEVESTPAPYFDNVRLETYVVPGPALWTREGWQANDDFPAGGGLLPADLTDASVRFDMAMNVAPVGEPRNDPGDSVVIRVTPRPGAALSGPPLLHYRLDRNPAYDAGRTAGLPDEGSIECRPVGGPVADAWWADLPDTGFLYPGDVLRWYFTASDDLSGDLRTSLLPADTTGFSVDDPYLAHFGAGFPAAFTMRALPTVRAGMDPPRVLFWHDSGTDTDWEEWLRALSYSGGGLPGVDYDIFHTKEAGSGLGNGLGGRATVDQLAVYDVVFHTSGDMDRHTLADGDFAADASDDVGLLDAWLRLGGRNLMVSGNALVADLAGRTDPFLADWLGVALVADDHTDLLDGRNVPVVYIAPGNPVFASVSSWLVYGPGCQSQERGAGLTPPGASRINAVRALPGTDRLAAYGDPGPDPVVAGLAAVALHEVPAHDATVVTMPADLALVWTDAEEWTKAAAPEPARDRLVGDVLSWFGVAEHGFPTGVPDAGALAVVSSPNPFNPSTSIAYSVGRAGHLSLKIYDLAGRLVTTLVDGPVQGSGVAEWDGRAADGGRVASGVYFYRVRFGEAVKVGKLALIK